MKKKFILTAVVTINLFILISDSNSQMTWNQAASFSGSASSYIAVPHSASLNITGDFTIEAWLNPVNVSSPSAQIILQKRAASANGYTLYLSSGRVAIRTNSTTRLIGKTVIPNNQWTHVAGAYTSSTNTFRVYINGLQDTSATPGSPAAPAANTDSILIGVGSNSPFEGLMDEVRIWNNDLSLSGIQLVMRTSLGVSSGYYNGLVMSLNFQSPNPAGTLFSLTDWCGKNNDGFNRGVTPNSISDIPSSTISVNESVSLDGSGDYLSGADQSSVSPVSAVTLEAWVYPRSFNASTSIYSTIIHKGNSTGSITDYRFEIQKKALRFYVNEAAIFGLSTSGEFFPLNQWTHFAITYSGSSGFIKFFHNGEIRWDDTNFVGNIHNGTDSIYIGGTQVLTCFDGYIDEVKIISSDLSYEQISNQVFTSMNEANDPLAVNVVWNFDGGLVSNSDAGPRLSLRGDSKFSHSSYFNNTPTSPMTFSNITNFADGFYLSNNIIRIPSAETSGFMVSDTIDVPFNEPISDINIFAGLIHTDEDNLIITLISPSGSSVIVYNTSSLINNNDNLSTIFDDQATEDINSGPFVMFTPRVKPQNNINSMFSGSSTKGKWKLKIQDAASGDTGKLYGWGIQFNNQSKKKCVLSIASFIQGFYNPLSNLTTPDTMRVLIRSSDSPYEVFEESKAVLNDSGKADFIFNNVPTGQPVFIQLKHRNSVETWSRKPSSSVFNILNSIHFNPFTSYLRYDFSSSQSAAFGNNLVLIDTSPNKYGIYSGDVNQDGSIDLTDNTLIDNDYINFVSGYVKTDLNGDNFVDLVDATIADNNAFNFVSTEKP